MSTILTRYLPITDPKHPPIAQLLEVAYAKVRDMELRDRETSIDNEPLASVPSTEERGRRIMSSKLGWCYTVRLVYK